MFKHWCADTKETNETSRRQQQTFFGVLSFKDQRLSAALFVMVESHLQFSKQGRATSPGTALGGGTMVDFVSSCHLHNFLLCQKRTIQHRHSVIHTRHHTHMSCGVKLTWHHTHTHMASHTHGITHTWHLASNFHGITNTNLYQSAPTLHFCNTDIAFKKKKKKEKT